jgi:radical SAM protein with 4Fe4S-binding SPASM domain
MTRDGLPLAPIAPPARRQLPLAEDARPIDRRWLPVYCVWELTLRCNLACRHCGSRAGRARPDELTTDEALRVVAELAELQVMEVTLTGGEAYLREDWTQIARAVRDHGMTASMVTAARTLTAERAREARDAGIEAVSVSIDGLEAAHDGLREVDGSYRAAFEAIEHLRAQGIRVSCNTQIGRGNLRDVPVLLERLIDAGVRAWQLQLTVAMGRASDDPVLLIEPFQMLEVLPMVARLKRRTDEAGVRLWPADDIGYFGPYESLLRGMMPRGHLASCGAGRSCIGLEANGDVKGCLSLPTTDYVGGNVRDYPLRDIWERGIAMRFTRERSTSELWGYCQSCYYADTCLAGCSGTSHVLFGRTGNNPLCHHRALELLAAGKRERLVRLEAASGDRPFDHGQFDIVVEDWPEAGLAQARRVAETGEGWLLSS